MESKVYVIECSKGNWSDSAWWIGGVFTDPQKAEKEKERMNLEQKENNTLECPIKKHIEEMNDEELEIYTKWNDLINDAEDWNPAKVVEYTLNG
jgi:hypothetical protein